MNIIKVDVAVYIYGEPVDMRKSINGLSAIVHDEQPGSVQSGELFVFYNQAKNKVKILFWHVNGFVLLQKGLDKGRFKIKHGGKTITITQQQCEWLLAGLEFDLMAKFEGMSFSNFY